MDKYEDIKKVYVIGGDGWQESDRDFDSMDSAISAAMRDYEGEDGIIVMEYEGHLVEYYEDTDTPVYDYDYTDYFEEVDTK